MVNTGLYLLTVLIWGTTWIAIKLQLGEVAVQASILYRFSVAALVLFAVLLLSRRLQKIERSDHLFCFIQGCCLFCFNFFCIYTATGYISSGLASVIFSMATVMNVINNRLWFGLRPALRTVLGSCLGLGGVAALFWPQITDGGFNADVLLGMGLAALGTWFFSSGNMVSVRHQKKGLKTTTTNAWSMFYGVLMMSVIILLQGVPLTFSWDTRYIGSLLYLAIPGTVIGFTAYLILVGRIGADKAAYSTVMFPAVALTISTFYEGYQWTELSRVGFGLVVLGNIMIFARWPGSKIPAVLRRLQL
ncbi:DMT family transporter [Oceanospirillum linum]|uniref:EamA family transporter n=1 Tax=Oceanospirillum linum TaxID=966 RepID=A0A1T1HF82_OCELI|nr:DMT family transporter [Oceanospirillum linum]OOV88538.1 EamA family transporter [Oceanospirillum linum]SEF59902.1 Permease of the drug/metabolite transporter (DMT) superfamily [Oleiphilus messinensis]SMP06841.1 Permease of the drug/metabolite transporter (DMT) superfamily [Oceanospirillum linum]